MSDLLRLLMINKPMSDSLKNVGIKKSKILFFSMFYIRFFIQKRGVPSFLFLMSDVSESLRSLTKNEQCEQIAHVAHLKWITMSKLLRSLIFLQKTSDLLRKPMSEFPALINTQSMLSVLSESALYKMLVWILFIWRANGKTILMI